MKLAFMIALVTEQRYPQLTDDDRQLLPAFAARGAEVRIVRWDDPGADWSAFDSVIIRSPWDYHRRFPEFTAWLDRLERAGARVWNPLKWIRWNIDKHYLEGMAHAGLPLIPFEIFSRGSRVELEATLGRLGWDEAVVKPTVSASGRETWRVSRATAVVRQADLDRLLAAEDVMIQPFVPEILREGEVSFLFYGGEFSHAVVKRAARGEFRIQLEHGGTIEPIAVPPAWIEQARRHVRYVPEPLLYARVDVIPVRGGKELWLGELEILEPHLYFAFDPQAPARFVDAYLRLSASWK